MQYAKVVIKVVYYSTRGDSFITCHSLFRFILNTSADEHRENTIKPKPRFAVFTEINFTCKYVLHYVPYYRCIRALFESPTSKKYRKNNVMRAANRFFSSILFYVEPIVCVRKYSL